MMKLIKKHFKLISICLFLLIGLSLVLFFIYYLNLQNLEKVTWEYWQAGDERRGGLVISNSIKENRDKRYTVISFFKPTTQTILLKEKVNDDLFRVQFETFYLERTGINSFKVKESIISSSTAYTFSEAVEISKKYDVYKNNPDPEKIFNYPKLNLTPEQKQEQILTPEKIKAGEIEDKAIELCGGVFPPLGDPKLDQFFACYDAKIIELTNAG